MDEDLQADWRGVLLGLKILRDALDDGRHLTINHPAYISEDADMKALLIDAVTEQVKEILDGAEIVREGNDNAA